jgi:hypothetical protein
VGEGVRWWRSRWCRVLTHLGLVNVSVIGCDQETDKSQLCPKWTPQQYRWNYIIFQCEHLSNMD